MVGVVLWEVTYQFQECPVLGSDYKKGSITRKKTLCFLSGLNTLDPGTTLG